jgi:hypothetical protein
MVFSADKGKYNGTLQKGLPNGTLQKGLPDECFISKEVEKQAN